jgi:carbamoyltransferase
LVILGIFGPGPNPSAALLIDGKIIAWAEEERFNRIKTSPNSLPVQSSKWCLDFANIKLDDVDKIAYGWDSPNYISDTKDFFLKQRKIFSDDYSYNHLQEDLLINLYHPDRIAYQLQISLSFLSEKRKIPPIEFFKHHECHVASAFYSSDFKSSNIISIDGSGEEVSTMLCYANQNKIEVIKSFKLPNTLGGFYATFTEFLGFRAYHDEGKVMGLASYGKYQENLQHKLDKFIPFDPNTGEFSVNPNLRYIGKHTFGSRFTDQFVDIFGTPRTKESPLESKYADLAFALQLRLENIVNSLTNWLYEQTGSKNLCLAGGVAMNCVMNGHLAKMDCIENIFVQPAASDNGVSLGAAQLLNSLEGGSENQSMKHLYWGPEFSENEIKKALDESKLKYRKSDNICLEVAKKIYDGKIIGWFQGRMEVGARALGNRSIIASPLVNDMQDKINLEVKHRENWRPFCPSMKEEEYDKYIDASAESPYMIMAFPVRQKFKSKIPAVVHVDGTARPQAVSKEYNQRFWNLLDEFEKLSGHPVLINSSFNIQGEPIVCSPSDALRTFGGTGLDVLAIGDFILEKNII